MKKVFAVMLAVALMMSLSVTAFAANTTGGSTELSFNVDPTYTITIPETVTLEKKNADGVITYENDYEITAEAGVRLHKGDTIVVTVDSDYEMTTRQGATLDYTITKDGTDLTDSIVATFITSTAAQSSTIHIAANDPEYAGEYKDTVTFTIGVKKPAPTLISFTIDGTSYQAEEGMTWAEWVESAYNNGGFYSAYESVYWGEDLWFILCNSGKTPVDDDYYVNEDDVIQANTDYVLVEMTEA